MSGPAAPCQIGTPDRRTIGRAARRAARPGADASPCCDGPGRCSRRLAARRGSESGMLGGDAQASGEPRDGAAIVQKWTRQSRRWDKFERSSTIVSRLLKQLLAGECCRRPPFLPRPVAACDDPTPLPLYDACYCTRSMLTWKHWLVLSEAPRSRFRRPRLLPRRHLTDATATARSLCAQPPRRAPRHHHSRLVSASGAGRSSWAAAGTAAAAAAAAAAATTKVRHRKPLPPACPRYCCHCRHRRL